MRADIPFRLKCLLDPASYAAIEEDYTGGVLIDVFDDSDKAGTDVVLHGRPQGCMPIPVESLLEAYEDMVDVLLVLEIFLTEDS